MAKLTVKASELRDVSVNFVSLVKRGANRIPFRVLKSEGDVAFDLGSFFTRKADADEAERVSTRKTEDMVKAATDVLTRAGYQVTLKSEPASDGSGKDETKNPAAGSDAGGTRNDGTSAGGTSTENPASGSDAGGTRDDGTGTSTVIAKADDADEGDKKLPPFIKKKIAASKATKASNEDDDEDEGAGADDDGDEDDKPAKKSEKKVAKAAKTKMDASDNGDAEEADESDEEEAAEDDEDKAPAKKSAKAKKSETVAKSGDDMLRELFAKHEQSLAAFSQEIAGRFDTLSTRFDLVDGRLQKTETAVADTGRRMTALVPGQSAPDADVRVFKTDKHFPLLDTAFGSRD